VILASGLKYVGLSPTALAIAVSAVVVCLVMYGLIVAGRRGPIALEL